MSDYNNKDKVLQSIIDAIGKDEPDEIIKHNSNISERNLWNNHTNNSREAEKKVISVIENSKEEIIQSIIQSKSFKKSLMGVILMDDQIDKFISQSIGNSLLEEKQKISTLIEKIIMNKPEIIINCISRFLTNNEDFVIKIINKIIEQQEQKIYTMINNMIQNNKEHFIKHGEKLFRELLIKT